MDCSTAISPVAQLKPVVPTQLLREKIRNYSRQQREKSRTETCDALRFGLGEIQAKIEELENLNEKDVHGLAVRIKRRKHATVEDLYRLSHAFLQNNENIRTFAKIPGAIQVLVKELTGNNAESQVNASECICNLSLGEAAVCEKIANLAGSYLVTYLGSSEEHLKRASLWTLANILATGGKGAQALMQMALVPKLWMLYIALNEGTAAEEDANDYREDAAICLQIISLPANKLLKKADRIFVRYHFNAKNPTCVAGEYHLQIVFNCGVIQPSTRLTDAQILYLVNYALSNLSRTKDFQTASSRLRILYSVRVLGNLLASQPKTYSLLLHQMYSMWQTNPTIIFNKLFAFRDGALTRETFWLLQIFLAEEGQCGANVMQSSLLDNLRVYRVNETEFNAPTITEEFSAIDEEPMDA